MTRRWGDAQVGELLASAPKLGASTRPPAHVRIEQWLAGLIGHGHLVPGDRLPPEQRLAAALGVSRMTLRQALAGMESRGVIVRVPGRTGGTFVIEPRIECDLTGLVSFTEQVRRANKRPGARLVGAETRRATRAEGRALGLGAGGQVHEVVRVRSANRQPLALEQACLPADLFPGLLERRFTGSLYRLMSDGYGLLPHTATEVLEPVIAGPYEAGLLEVPEGSPLIVIVRTAYTTAGRAVEYSRDTFRSDRTRIVVRAGLDS